MNTGNKNGRPLSERNNQIIVDYKNGMTSKELAEKHHMTHGYVQKIASEYKRKDRLKVEEMHKKTLSGIYAERDNEILKFVKRAGEKITVHRSSDDIRKNKGYTQRKIK